MQPRNLSTGGDCLYFGCWDRLGHYLHSRGGQSVHQAEYATPWKWHIDGQLCPGMAWERERWRRVASEVEGQAAVHHKGGWTALAFPDNTIDKRGASNSCYLVNRTLTFAEMIEAAKATFPEIWGRYRFQVIEAPAEAVHHCAACCDAEVKSDAE